jgi:hypothetical protein
MQGKTLASFVANEWTERFDQGSGPCAAPEPCPAETKEWSAIATSGDGTKLAAVVNAGKIWNSVQGNAQVPSWTESATSPQKAWSAIAMNKDGKFQAATVAGRDPNRTPHPALINMGFCQSDLTP